MSLMDRAALSLLAIATYAGIRWPEETISNMVTSAIGAALFAGIWHFVATRKP